MNFPLYLNLQIMLQINTINHGTIGPWSSLQVAFHFEFRASSIASPFMCCSCETHQDKELACWLTVMIKVAYEVHERIIFPKDCAERVQFLASKPLYNQNWLFNCCYSSAPWGSLEDFLNAPFHWKLCESHNGTVWWEHWLYTEINNYCQFVSS